MVNESIARFYTRSRRYPKFIGRMTDGSRIPGGPYTMPQVSSAGCMFLGLMVTKQLWTTHNVILDLTWTVILTGLTLYAVGFIPITRRNIAAVVMDAIAAMFKPVEGSYQGKVPKLRKPHLAGGTCVVIDVDGIPGFTPDPVADPVVLPVPVEPAAPKRAVPALALAGSARPRVPQSAVELLIQQAKSTKEQS